MAFKRALWKSGLTYQQQCDQCHTTIKYQDDILDFRPWYADGFIYCPKCHKPLRHNEKYAIDKLEESFVDLCNSSTTSEYCSSCGRKFLENERFCPNCGSKKNS